MAETNTKPKAGDLQVWWIPQMPGKPFRTPVRNLREAKLLLDTLARYDKFQLENRIKPDYANAGGLSVFDPEIEDPNGDNWIDWSHPETGEDFDEYCARNPELMQEPLMDRYTDINIRVVEKGLQNVSYIQRRGGRWLCKLSNGIAASFSYAGVLKDETGFVVKLDKAKSEDEALKIVQASIGRNYTAELV